VGIQRASFIIDSVGKFAAIWLKLKVAGHAADVLETLKAL
jgi:thioredoxin-dependent peroxiredoxin